MAEGLLRHDSGDLFDVESAGTKPGAVRVEAIAVMAEIGIDITSQRSKHVDEFKGQRFDTIITVCDNAKESCPVFPGEAERVHQNFDDPPPATEGTEAERFAVFRRVRDELRNYLREFSRRETH
jgi:arsenate reductase